MSTLPVVVQGTVQPDGTLVLDERLQLPTGRVQVTVQPLATSVPGGEDWWQFLQRARAELEKAGQGFRTQEEIEAEREDFRSGDERIEEVLRQVEAARASPENL
jgi:hypothetical protein